ncbi:MAG: biotin--[acetyl-CoA-carboxylase] ligase [Burkholderiales bacterium]|jgi:BirA family biotin operon repressor/biotin-[acetyl-CoA-carboxylase] ligase|nr:biotin--[acetyl-CoA-carboxylase] ligase [Burkholderiales bacterium]
MHPGTFAIYRVLADGEAHDAGALWAAAGLTREDADAACADLTALGASLLSGEGRVRLAHPVELLDPQRIAAQLGDARARVAVVPVCESTNTLALEHARSGAPSGTTIACEIQTAGRGRRGNRWAAPPGGSIALSMIWQFPPASMPLSGLSLVAGLACVDAIGHSGVHGVGLKWPNDLVARGRKLGGILVEVAGSAAVIGVGLNVRLPATLTAALGQPAIDLAALGAAPGRNALVAAVARGLAQSLAGFETLGFAAYRDAWAARHALQGERVFVLPAGGAPVEGRAIGVADDGALLVETAHGVERFVSAEVSLRAAA